MAGGEWQRVEWQSTGRAADAATAPVYSGSLMSATVAPNAAISASESTKAL
jgi:hypothetical protein